MKSRVRNHFGQVIVIILCLLPTLAESFNLLSLLVDVINIFLPSEGTNSWESYSGSLLPAFPDLGSRYDVFSFAPSTGEYEILQVTGHFPQARYFGFTLYDETLEVVSTLFDQQIKADDGSINPFQVGIDRANSAENTYTLWLVKESVDTETLSLSGNIIQLPEDASDLLLTLRTYSADDGYDTLGGVALPTITALRRDRSTGALPDKTNTRLTIMESALDTFFPTMYNLINIAVNLVRYRTPREVTFLNVQFPELLVNPDNQYLLGSDIPEDIPFSYSMRVAVFTFKPPSFEKTRMGEPLQGGTDVRYWSLCVGNGMTTFTAGCLIDDRATFNEDGTVTLVAASPGYRQLVEEAQLNFVAWSGLTAQAMFVFRQLLPNASFAGAIQKAPLVRDPALIDQAVFDRYRADNAMGEYKIVGQMLTNSELREMLEAPSS